MALYWPDQKVALQIDDDPLAKPFDGPDDWTVVHTTVSQMSSFDTFDETMAQLAKVLGTEVDQRYRESRRRLFEQLNGSLDDLDDEGDLIVDLDSGDVSKWEGDVPTGSFCTLENGLTMCTPEFFYLREATKRTLPQQMQLGYELCGFYSMEHHGTPTDYEVFDESVTSVDELRSYLAGARSLDGYRRAMKALDYVVEGSTSPAASYMAILLTTPRHMGGYDLYRPRMNLRLVDAIAHEHAPTEDGRYESYDLCWPRQHVVVQFVGDRQPNRRERRALEAPDVADMFVVCVTSSQLADPEAFEEAARLVADRLGTPLQASNDAFLQARNKLREELEFPSFGHMRSMAEDWHWHENVGR